mmetsp:Transcript_6175/g.14757  ORF Transcript_6175/g.14757 Transcript_6175/m.14757 type:complete len:374 (+) Transcript_6175:68-1189(+)
MNVRCFACSKACLFFLFDFAICVIVLSVSRHAKESFEVLLDSSGSQVKVKVMVCDLVGGRSAVDVFVSAVDNATLNTTPEAIMPGDSEQLVNNTADSDLWEKCSDASSKDKLSFGIAFSSRGGLFESKAEAQAEEMLEERQNMFDNYAICYFGMLFAVWLKSSLRDFFVATGHVGSQLQEREMTSVLPAPSDDSPTGMVGETELKKRRCKGVCMQFNAAWKELCDELHSGIIKVYLIGTYLCTVHDGYFITPFIPVGFYWYALFFAMLSILWDCIIYYVRVVNRESEDGVLLDDACGFWSLNLLYLVFFAIPAASIIYSADSVFSGGANADHGWGEDGFEAWRTLSQVGTLSVRGMWIKLLLGIVLRLRGLPF